MHRLFAFLASGSFVIGLAGVGLPTRAARPEAVEPEPACQAVWYADADGDGYGVAGSSVVACRAPRGFATVPGDCDDTRAEVRPGAEEVCNDRDDDCDGLADEAPPIWFRDADGDAWGDPSNTWRRCDRPVGYTAKARDCDDTDDGTHPGAGC